MALISKIFMIVLNLLIKIPVGIAIKKLVERIWLAARLQEPPRKPAQPGVVWTDAIGWAALSAAGVIASQLITRRSSEAAFRVITGVEPPPPKPTRAEKKLVKASEKAGIVDDD